MPSEGRSLVCHPRAFPVSTAETARDFRQTACVIFQMVGALLSFSAMAISIRDDRDDVRNRVGSY